MPAYKEQKNISMMYDALHSQVFPKLIEKYNFEIIYVNDGSPDT